VVSWCIRLLEDGISCSFLRSASKCRRRAAQPIAIGILTLCGLAAPASAAEEVPFTATGTAAIRGVTHLPGGLIQVSFSPSGTATHLDGRSELFAETPTPPTLEASSAAARVLG
jgi:hypothetical protein